MEFIKKNLNKIIGGIVVLVIITFIYNHFFNNQESDYAESKEVLVEENEVDQISRDILQTLDKLEKIHVDTDFFADDLSLNKNLVSFYELIDFSKTNIAPKKIGKQNPFSADSEFYLRIYNSDELNSNNNAEQDAIDACMATCLETKSNELCMQECNNSTATTTTN